MIVDMSSTPKLAVVVRRDLRLRRAEVASYVARATSMFLYDNRDPTDNNRLVVPFTSEESEWFYGDQKVIVLGVQSESVLRSVMDRAEVQGMTVSSLVRKDYDSKLGGDYALICAAIGPHDGDSIDSITGGLKLM